MFGFSTFAETPFCSLPQVGGFVYDVFIFEDGGVAATVTSTVLLLSDVTERGAARVDDIFVQGDYSAQAVEQSVARSESQTGLRFVSLISEQLIGSEQVSALTLFITSTTEGVFVLEDWTGSVDFVSLAQENGRIDEFVRADPFYRGHIEEALAADEATSGLVDFAGQTAEGLIAQDPKIAPQLVSNLVLFESVSGAALPSSNADFPSALNEHVEALDEAVAKAEFFAAIAELGVMADSPLGRLLWEIINDSQPQVWQNLDTAADPTWAVVVAKDESQWQQIDTADTADWEVKPTDADPNWGTVKTLN